MATLSDMKESFLELSPEDRLILIHKIRTERRKRVEKKIGKPRKTSVNSKPRKPKYDISQVSNEMLLEAAKQRGLR